MVDVHWKVLSKQLDFIASQARSTLYSGAWGSGKSIALCLKLLEHATIPGNEVGLVRKTLTSLKATTLATLLQGDGIVPAVLPRGSYVHNRGDNTIQIAGGGTIRYFGCDMRKDESQTKIRSMNLGAIGIDEMTELTEPEFVELDGRCRRAVDPHNQLFGACNPEAPGHWIHKRWFGESDPDDALIQTCAADNHYLPKSYLKTLDRLTGMRRARYRDGLWVGSDRLVYEGFDQQVHITERQGPWREWVYGVDWGYTNPAVILAFGIDGDGRMHQVAEWYRRETPPAEVVAEMVRMRERYGDGPFWCDPSEPGQINDARAAGLDAHAADNRVLPGLNRVRQLLVVAGDGRSRLTIDPSCTKSIEEFGSYEHKPESDEPVKECDHTHDARRYAVVGVHGIDKVQVRLDVVGEDDGRPEPREDALSRADVYGEEDDGDNGDGLLVGVEDDIDRMWE